MSVAETAAVDQGDPVCEENLSTRIPRRQSATPTRSATNLARRDKLFKKQLENQIIHQEN